MGTASERRAGVVLSSSWSACFLKLLEDQGLKVEGLKLLEDQGPKVEGLKLLEDQGLKVDDKGLKVEDQGLKVEDQGLNLNLRLTAAWMNIDFIRNCWKTRDLMLNTRD